MSQAQVTNFYCAMLQYIKWYRMHKFVKRLILTNLHKFVMHKVSESTFKVSEAPLSTTLLASI